MSKKQHFVYFFQWDLTQFCVNSKYSDMTSLDEQYIYLTKLNYGNQPHEAVYLFE